MPFFHYCKKKEPRYKEAEIKTYRTGWRSKVFRPSGGYFKGEWKSCFQNGKGVQLLPSRYQYEGDWLFGKKNGFGVLSKYQPSDKIFRLVYMGQYENNKEHGYGSIHYEDGTYYQGEFRCGKKNGFGKCWFANGSYYEGYWFNDLQHGFGMFVQANGNRYEGEWQHGKKNGFGSYFHLGTSQKQIGVWENEICITSTMEDLKFRQSALYPTPYPIPQLELWPNAPCLLFLESLEKIINSQNENCQCQE